MRDGSSTTPEPTSPPSTIPGWRLIISDAGRLWASREIPFSQVAAHAGAERTVDGDSLEELRAETDRQETFAREAEERATQEREVQERTAQERATQEQEVQEALALEERATREREQAGKVVS